MMMSNQVINQLSLPIFAIVRSFQDNLQAWIRKEIVDDDPYDQETSFLQENEK